MQKNPSNNNPLKTLRSHELNVRGKTKALNDHFFAEGRSQNQSLVFRRPLEQYGQRHLNCHQSKLQKKNIAWKREKWNVKRYGDELQET